MVILSIIVISEHHFKYILRKIIKKKKSYIEEKSNKEMSKTKKTNIYIILRYSPYKKKKKSIAFLDISEFNDKLLFKKKYVVQLQCIKKIVF